MVQVLQWLAAAQKGYLNQLLSLFHYFCNAIVTKPLDLEFVKWVFTMTLRTHDKKKMRESRYIGIIIDFSSSY